MKVYLAPLEGLADPPLRKILCACGGYDCCYTEFIRVTDEGLSPKTLLHDCPELENGGMTDDGTPCRVQLLGDNPGAMAQAAALAAKMGAPGVDINFGCPSRFVHHSGSMLLREPGLMRSIVLAVRGALPPSVPLTVKIRSGFADKSELPAIMEAVAQEGVSEVAVHCRTRAELYRRDALDWSVLKPLHEAFPNTLIVANGDIISRQSAAECVEQSGCGALMVGRGAFMVPNLGHVIKDGDEPFGMAQTLAAVRRTVMLFVSMGFEREKVVTDRAKQFLSYARMSSPEVAAFFRAFCHCQGIAECLNMIDSKIRELDDNGEDRP
ncbi:MAG: tRNA-dihydrouridine synthase [Succinivibrio sp.]